MMGYAVAPLRKSNKNERRGVLLFVSRADQIQMVILPDERALLLKEEMRERNKLK